MFSAILSLGIFKEIQYLSVLLLYPVSQNDNPNSSCIAAAVNETFHGRLKSHLQGDKTVLMYICSLENFILREIVGASVVE